MKISDFLKKPRAWLVALVIYLSAIFIVSGISASDLPIIRFPNWDKIVHFVEYLPVGFMLAGLLRSKLPGARFILIIPGVAMIAMALGGFDEFHQSFVPGREVSLGDAIADVLGATAGAALAAQFVKMMLLKSETTGEL